MNDEEITKQFGTEVWRVIEEKEAKAKEEVLNDVFKVIRELIANEYDGKWIWASDVIKKIKSLSEKENPE